MTKKFSDLSDRDLNMLPELDQDSWKKLYRDLRDHHIDETTTLYGKLAASREEGKRLRSMLEDKIYRELIETVMRTNLPDPDQVAADAIRAVTDEIQQKYPPCDGHGCMWAGCRNHESCD